MWEKKALLKGILDYQSHIIDYLNHKNISENMPWEIRNANFASSTFLYCQYHLYQPFYLSHFSQPPNLNVNVPSLNIAICISIHFSKEPENHK